MSILDITLLLILIFFIIKGLIRGIILEVLTLIGMVVALIMALYGMEKASLFIASMITLPDYLLSSLGFFCIFLIVVLIFRLAAILLKKLIRKTPIAILDRLGGLLSGLIKGVLVACLAAYLFSWIPIRKADYTREKEKSLLLKPSMAIAPFLLNLIRDWVPEARIHFNKLKDQITDAVPLTRTKTVQDSASHSN
jgi:membrane protein required for colicin V production